MTKKRKTTYKTTATMRLRFGNRMITFRQEPILASRYQSWVYTKGKLHINLLCTYATDYQAGKDIEVWEGEIRHTTPRYREIKTVRVIDLEKLRDPSYTRAQKSAQAYLDALYKEVMFELKAYAGIAGYTVE